MEVVGPRLGNHIHLGPRIAAIFRAKIVSQDTNLLDGVWRRIVHAGVS